MNALVPVLAQESQGSPLGLLFILVPFGLLIYLMVVPQRKQRARQQQLVSSLSAGDEVVTAGGIVGVINVVEDELVHLEVDNDVVIRVAKASVSRNLSEPVEETKGGFLSGLLGGGGGGSSSSSASEDTPVVSRRVTPKQGSSGTGSSDAGASGKGTGKGANGKGTNGKGAGGT